MLFKEVHLKGIRSGDIHLAFRRWTKCAVKKGSLQKTSVGLLEITDVAVVPENKITVKDARDAGFETVAALFDSLRANEGDIYKIRVKYYSADPRIELRETNVLSEKDFKVLKTKLEKLDQYSKQGNWTLEILTLIKQNPGRRAVELASLIRFEKEWLKLNVRKLKNLGLTISHEVGYEISPLGKLFLDRLRKN